MLGPSFNTTFEFQNDFAVNNHADDVCADHLFPVVGEINSMRRNVNT